MKAQRVVVDTPDHRIEVALRPGETPADVQPDIERSRRFIQEMRADGTQAWRGHYRWLGPVKIMVYKEVGPPPWRWPRLALQHKRGRRMYRLITGWRSTAYAVCFLWAGQHGEHRTDERPIP